MRRGEMRLPLQPMEAKGNFWSMRREPRWLEQQQRQQPQSGPRLLRESQASRVAQLLEIHATCAELFHGIHATCAEPRRMTQATCATPSFHSERVHGTHGAFEVHRARSPSALERHAPLLDGGRPPRPKEKL